MDELLDITIAAAAQHLRLFRQGHRSVQEVGAMQCVPCGSATPDVARVHVQRRCQPASGVGAITPSNALEVTNPARHTAWISRKSRGAPRSTSATILLAIRSSRLSNKELAQGNGSDGSSCAERSAIWKLKTLCFPSSNFDADHITPSTGADFPKGRQHVFHSLDHLLPLVRRCCSNPPGIHVVGRSIIEIVQQAKCAAQRDPFAQDRHRRWLLGRDRHDRAH